MALEKKTYINDRGQVSLKEAYTQLACLLSVKYFFKFPKAKICIVHVCNIFAQPSGSILPETYTVWITRLYTLVVQLSTYDTYSNERSCRKQMILFFKPIDKNARFWVLELGSFKRELIKGSQGTMKSSHQHCQSHELLRTAREIFVQGKGNPATDPAWIAFNAKNQEWGFSSAIRSVTRFIQNWILLILHEYRGLL